MEYICSGLTAHCEFLVIRQFSQIRSLPGAGSGAAAGAVIKRLRRMEKAFAMNFHILVYVLILIFLRFT